MKVSKNKPKKENLSVYNTKPLYSHSTVTAFQFDELVKQINPKFETLADILVLEQHYNLLPRMVNELSQQLKVADNRIELLQSELDLIKLSYTKKSARERNLVAYGFECANLGRVNIALYQLQEYNQLPDLATINDAFSKVALGITYSRYRVILNNLLKAEPTTDTLNIEVKGITHAQQILLLDELGFFELEMVKNLTEQKKGLLVSQLLNRNPKNTEEMIRNKQGADKESKYFIKNKRNIEIINQIISKVNSIKK